MKLSHYFAAFNDYGEIIASFGRARLVKYLNGKYELRDGSREDRLAAREWISLFCHEVIVREVPPVPLATLNRADCRPIAVARVCRHPDRV